MISRWTASEVLQSVWKEFVWFPLFILDDQSYISILEAVGYSVNPSTVTGQLR